MFSKSKRFDYHPTPNAETLPTCVRCATKHKECICSSTSKIPILISRILNPKNTPNETKILQRSHTFSIPNKSSNPNSSTDADFYTSAILSTAPNLSSSDEEPSSSTATFSRRKPKVEMDHSSTEVLAPSSSTSSVEYAEVMDQQPPQGLNSPKPTKDKLLKYIDHMEKKIDDQRRKVNSLRWQVGSSSSEESFPSSVPPPSVLELSIEERIKNFEDSSSFCVKETLDFVIMYNKNREQNGDVGPQEYNDLVDFCSSLVKDVNSRFHEKMTKWSKTKKFFGRVCRRFGKVFRR